MINDIIAYEEGELDLDGYLRLFSNLIRTGQAWTLQGHYGRTAAALIEMGIITREGDIAANAVELLQDGR